MNEIAFPALLILGVVATEPGPAIVTIAGDVPAGNWILATGVISIVLGKFWIESFESSDVESGFKEST